MRGRKVALVTELLWKENGQKMETKVVKWKDMCYDKYKADGIFNEMEDAI